MHTISIQNYKDTLAGAEVMLEFITGKERDDMLEFIGRIKVIIEFMEINYN